ncbi:hypothetical protein ACK8HX_02185 [Oryzobacter sp. R7]|uniref:hypothetical protein n=1 Tax=Oryzobacter faecalis TaxID=3388656 RepID=UPI00398C893E
MRVLEIEYEPGDARQRLLDALTVERFTVYRPQTPEAGDVVRLAAIDAGRNQWLLRQAIRDHDAAPEPIRVVLGRPPHAV